MSAIIVPGFDSSEHLSKLGEAFDNFSGDQKSKLLKEVNGVFQFVIKKDGKEEIFTIDCKKEGKVVHGKGNTKADAIITITDKDFVDLVLGKLNGQKAYMSGKLKIKGQMMLAMKLDNVFKAVKPKDTKPASKL